MLRTEEEARVYASLIERLEKAEGPDREIDDALWRALTPDTYLYAQSGRTWAVNRHGTVLTPVWEMCADPREHYTSSLEAALSLVERKLPGWSFSCGDDAPITQSNPMRHPCWARVFPRGEQSRGSGNQYGATPALAVCLALLRALSAQASSIKAKV